MTAKLSDNVAKLLSEGRFKEAGRAAGHEIQARMRANVPPRRRSRRSGGLWRKAVDWRPDDPAAFVTQGGMERLERTVGARAADAAIRFERELWLPRLESWHAAATHPLLRTRLEIEIARLRRALRIPPDPERKRALARARVAKWRARKAAAG